MTRIVNIAIPITLALIMFGYFVFKGAEVVLKPPVSVQSPAQRATAAGDAT